MRIATRPETINLEALMFGVMVGVIATTAMTILGGINFLTAALGGGLLAIVVWFAVTRLGKDLPPPRGAGNIDAGPAGPSSPPPSAPKKTMPEPVVASPSLQPGPLGGSSGGGGASLAASDGAQDETPGEKPVALTSARESGADDLKQIKGVGPKLEELLHSMGVYHFDQIADWTPAHVAWMDDNLEGFKGRVSRDDWVGQARNLAVH